MAKNLTPAELYTFITTDFEDVWNSVAWNPSARGRGNFLFAILSMAFLELTCRMCSSDKSGEALEIFSRHLEKIDRRYFSRINGLSISSEREFVLPYIGTEQTHDFLICALFDLIRNGLAHQYQQILVKMRDEKFLGVTLSGPARGIYLDKVMNSSRKNMNHLRLKRDSKGDFWLTISPARLFLDFRKAFDEANLLKLNLEFKPLTRPDPKYRGKVYAFDSASLTGLLSETKGGFLK